MQKNQIKQILTHKLSPQQIQFIKLLQVSTAELESRIEEELELNPALEEGVNDSSEDGTTEEDSREDNDDYKDEDKDKSDDYSYDDVTGYKMQGDGPGYYEDKSEMPIASQLTLHDSLLVQLGLLKLNYRQQEIGKQVIGSIDADGYLRRDMSSIVNDLAFSQNLDVAVEEVEEIVLRIQEFDPPGIAARDLQECLLIQLKKKNYKDNSGRLASRIVASYFDDFTKKHYEKLAQKLHVKDEVLKEAIAIITKLDPRPGLYSYIDSKTLYIIPDFRVLKNGQTIEVLLNSKNAPELRVSSSYTEMLNEYSKKIAKNKSTQEAIAFVKQKMESAKWFIDAIKQRQHTLLIVMNTIVQLQYDFFLEEDESKLKPMILKDIASKVEMDISTVSRIVNSKYVQTDSKVYPLKYFFSEGMVTESGDDVSTKEVKKTLKEFIDQEDKKKPLSDEKLEKMLHEKGYIIARRTVAKYREQLGIPVARLRKNM